MRRLGNRSQTGGGSVSLWFLSTWRLTHSRRRSMLSCVIPWPCCAHAGRGLGSCLSAARASEPKRLVWRKQALPRGVGLSQGSGAEGRETHPAASSCWAVWGCHRPSGLARQPSLLRSYVQMCSGQKVAKYISILAVWSPEQPVFAPNPPCLTTRMSNLLNENLQKAN